MKKFLGYLLAMSLILSACRPVTPIRTVTNPPSSNNSIKTPNSTLIIPATPTQQPPQLLSWLQIEPPVAGATAYKLRQWSDADYETFLQQAVKVSFPGQSIFDDDKFATILAEWILKNPASPEWQKGPWNLAIGNNSTNISFARGEPAKSPFTKVFELRANALHGEISAITFWLESNQFVVKNYLSAKGLFGKDSDAIVFLLAGKSAREDTLTAVFALRPSADGTYQVEPLIDWGDSYPDIVEIQVLPDFNQNGTIEIAAVASKNWQGTCYTNLSVYEWNGQNFSRLVPDATIAQGQSEIARCDLRKWHIGQKNENLMPPLIAAETNLSFADCPELELQRTFEWDQTESEYSHLPTKVEILPITSSSLTCQVIWAANALKYQQGPAVPQDAASKTLEAALENWDANTVQTFGPAGRDYFNLRLALWQESNQNEAAALKRLQNLAQKDQTESTLPTRLAGAYLKGKKALGAVGSCYLLNRIWNEVNNNNTTLFNSDGLSVEKTILGQIETLGFWAPESFLTGIEFCRLNNVTTPILTGLPTNDIGLTSRLNELAEVVETQSLDLNNDGRKDIVALLREPSSVLSYPYPRLWVFLNFSEGLKWLEIPLFDKFDPESFEFHNFSWQSVQPNKQEPAFFGIQVGNALVILQFNHDKLKFLNQFEGVKNFQFDKQTMDMLLSYQGTYRENERIPWDPERQSFPPSEIEKNNAMWFDQFEQISAIEKLIFQQQDFSKAANQIEQTLTTSNDWADYQRDYLNYLLGMACELSQQSEKAVAAYYKVWKSAPGGVLGMAASAKLELTAP